MFTVYTGAASYAIGAGMFFALTLLLLTAWRGRLQGGLLVSATSVSMLWCAAAAVFTLYSIPPFSAVLLLEILRNAAWFLFLLKALGYAAGQAHGPRSGLRLLAAGVLSACAAVALAILINRYAADSLFVGGVTRRIVLFGYLLLAIAGLTMVELLYRNTHPANRWAIKFLCLGIGGLFAYDLFLYSNALLFKRVDGALWSARGVVNAMVVPLLAVSARRNPEWSLDIFVSRHVVFHSAALLGAGAYLMVMAGAGYYIRLYGGTWGGVAQAAFLFGALLLLMTLMFSGQLRARAKVFLGKHFFQYKYDHREEWLKFTRRLSTSNRADALRTHIIQAIGEIVDSPGGLLWERDGGGRFQIGARWNLSEQRAPAMDGDSSLVRFLQSEGWVVFIDEYLRLPERYEGLELPPWVETFRSAWVIVPLIHGDELVAFIVLARSPTKTDFNWEDSDLLKTVGRQAASYIALLEVNEALTEARQFEAFNRLSAYVVHDLKNLVAQLALVVSNARRFKNSPEFIDDAITTVENATDKMNRLLAQLRKGRVERGEVRRVALNELLERVVKARNANRPAPRLTRAEREVHVMAEPDRLCAVLEHLVQNAQEATPRDGNVDVRVREEGDWAVAEVRDDGCGMDGEFVARRLFKPFDTTKGNAGMGVGVYESREFVRTLGGDVEVHSEPGAGTVFRVKIPSVRAADARPDGAGSMEMLS